MLSWLYRYRYLRLDHLIKIFEPKSEKRFKERLGDLFHETGLINRPTLQAPLFDARATPMLYEISSKGIAHLTAQNALSHRAVTFSRRHRDSFSPQFLHAMMIIETVLDIELTVQATPDQRFVPVDEILSRAPETTRAAPNPLSIPVTLEGKASHIIPDALYGVEYDKGGKRSYLFWALECERTSPNTRATGSASSAAKKRKAYKQLIATKGFDTHWNIPNLEAKIIRRDGSQEIIRT